MSRRATNLKAPLQYPAFRQLWLALTLSRLGDEFTLLALLWFTLQLTGSGTAIGLVLLCFQLPTIVTSPLIGRFLDRYQPRLIMGIDNFCRALIMVAFPILYWLHALQLWHIYALAFFSGVLAPATEVGVPVVIPHLVTDEDLEGANVLISMVWEIASLAGPAIAGLLVAFLGSPVVLLIDALSFLIMGFVTLSLPVVRLDKTEASTTEQGSWLGFGTLLRMKSVRLLSALTLLILFIQGLQSVSLSVYSQRTLVAGAFQYGLLLSAFGTGSVLGLLVLNSFLSRSERPGLTVATIFVLFGLLVLPLVFFRYFLVAMLFLVLAGFFAAPYFAIERSLVQRLVPAHLRGEVFGVRGSLSICGYPLGGAVGGILLDYLSAPLVIGLSCGICIAVGLAGFLSPTLRGVQWKGN